MGLVIAVLVVVALSVFFIVRQVQGVALDQGNPWMNARLGELFTTKQDRLRRLCHGDKDLVERLIAHERERDPKASRGEATRRAIRRYEGDLD